MPTCLTQPIHRFARQSPDAPALSFGERTIGWAGMRDTIARMAGGLAARGVGAGDRVALLTTNDDTYLLAILAILWTGGIAVPLNLRWSPLEIADALHDCGATLLLADGIRPDVATAVETLSIVALRETDATAAEDAMRGDADCALLMYTGGTTGRSKGVMISHAGLFGFALSYTDAGGGGGPTVLQFAPLFHIAGINGAWSALLAGRHQIYHAAFDPAQVLATIERARVTDMFVVPTMLQALVDHPRFTAHDLSSLRRIAYGASPIAAALLDCSMQLLPQVGFVQAYGMTELSPVATLLSPEDHLHPERRRSAGRATRITEVRIVDPDDAEVARGTIGEIAVRGGNMMLGYWGMPEATAEAMRGGWMHTGDLGHMDADGYVYVVDRLKDMIVSGGENVYSVEVENALASHPGVAQCAVIGMPHPHWGESVHAVVVPAPDAVLDLADLRRHCRETIAGFKCPRSLELRTALPLSAAGKVLKTELRMTRQVDG